MVVQPPSWPGVRWSRDRSPGSGARVHGGARVHRSVLLPGVTVGAGAVVSHSVVGERAVVGEEAQMSDLTVVGAGAEIAPVPAGRRSCADGRLTSTRW
jgi:NDP-sugar pyrophosphorylase family protein